MWITYENSEITWGVVIWSTAMKAMPSFRGFLNSLVFWHKSLGEVEKLKQSEAHSDILNPYSGYKLCQESIKNHNEPIYLTGEFQNWFFFVNF